MRKSNVKNGSYHNTNCALAQFCYNPFSHYVLNLQSIRCTSIYLGGRTTICNVIFTIFSTSCWPYKLSGKTPIVSFTWSWNSFPKVVMNTQPLRKYYICMIEKRVKKGNNKNGLISFILSLHPQIKLSIPNTSTD